MMAAAIVLTIKPKTFKNHDADIISIAEYSQSRNTNKRMVFVGCPNTMRFAFAPLASPAPYLPS